MLELLVLGQYVQFMHSYVKGTCCAVEEFFFPYSRVCPPVSVLLLQRMKRPQERLAPIPRAPAFRRSPFLLASPSPPYLPAGPEWPAGREAQWWTGRPLRLVQSWEPGMLRPWTRAAFTGRRCPGLAGERPAVSTHFTAMGDTSNGAGRWGASWAWHIRFLQFEILEWMWALQFTTDHTTSCSLFYNWPVSLFLLSVPAPEIICTVASDLMNPQILDI